MLVTVWTTTAPLTVMVCTLVIGVAVHVELCVCDAGFDAGAELACCGVVVVVVVAAAGVVELVLAAAPMVPEGFLLSAT